MKTIRDLAELGYVCGLDTLGEALCSVECHWDAFPPGTLDALYAEVDAAAFFDIAGDTLCVHVLGTERCHEIDQEIDAAFAYRNEGGAAADTEFSLP